MHRQNRPPSAIHDRRQPEKPTETSSFQFTEDLLLGKICDSIANRKRLKFKKVLKRKTKQRTSPGPVSGGSCGFDWAVTICDFWRFGWVLPSQLQIRLRASSPILTSSASYPEWLSLSLSSLSLSLSSLSPSPFSLSFSLSLSLSLSLSFSLFQTRYLLFAKTTSLTSKPETVYGLSHFSYLGLSEEVPSDSLRSMQPQR